MRKRRSLLRIFVAVILAALGAGAYRLWPMVEIGAAHAAMVACAAHFVSGRALESIRSQELSDPLLSGYELSVDAGDRSLTARLGPFGSSRAIHRDGLGCALVRGVPEAELRQQAAALRERPPRPAAWPAWAADGPARVDAGGLDAALDAAFAEPHERNQRRTRAVLVVHRGRIVAERYAPGFSAEMPLIGWSMTKSVTNALVGILVRQGRLDVRRPAPVPEWRRVGDPRGAITLDQLLRMSSGLKFVEVYSSPSDVLEMLLGRGAADTAAYAAAQPLEAEPDSAWSYSSGTTNIVSRIIRQQVGGSLADQVRFARAELFDVIGMRQPVVQADGSGTLVGSSYMYATARDWARLGLLYLRDGVWDGRRVLPEDWVAYSTAPTPRAPQGRYGAHWWLNAGDAANPSDRPFPRLPRDLFYASGHEGQAVSVVPSRDLVVVRMGNSQSRDAWSLEDLVADVLAALPGT